MAPAAPAAIVYDWTTDIRSGGPTGYLANLELAIAGAGLGGIDFITRSGAVQRETTPLGATEAPDRLEIGTPGLPDLVEFGQDPESCAAARRDEEALAAFLEQPEAIAFSAEIAARVARSAARVFHVHTTMDCIRLHNQLTVEGRRHEAKIVLTSHCPESPAREWADVSFGKSGDARSAEAVYANYRLIDRLAFVFADALLFPCPEAVEPYEATIPGFRNDFRHKPFYFLPTSAAPLRKSALADPKGRFGLGARFVACYLGRHNAIKGYDLLKRAANRLLDRHDDIAFLIAGSPGPIAPLEREGWIEHGWTQTPEDVLEASDVFVLPNRLTFFDLVLIEALAAGKIVLAANNGGNRYFAGRGAGVVLFDDEQDFVEKFEALRALSPDARSRMGEDNRRLYESEFRLEDFGRRYVELIGRIEADLAVKPPGSRAPDRPAVEISVIVPVFNVEAYLAQCLDSILAQDHPSFEIIVVDDGSTDGSAGILESYAGADRLRAIRQANAGLSEARNTGLLHARGEFVCFIDSDDYLERGFLSALHGQCLADGTDIAICEIIEFHEFGSRFVSTIHEDKAFAGGRAGHCEPMTPELVSRLFPSAWNKLFRTRLFERTHFPRGLLYEDNPVHYALMLRQERVSFVSRPLYWHRIDRGARISHLSSPRMLEVAMVASLVHSVLLAETNPIAAREVSARLLARLFCDRLWTVDSREIELSLSATLVYLAGLFGFDEKLLRRVMDSNIERSLLSDQERRLAKAARANGDRLSIAMKDRLAVTDRSVLAEGQTRMEHGQVSGKKDGSYLIHPDPQALVVAELAGLGLYGPVRYELLLRLEHEQAAPTEVRVVATPEPLVSTERLRALDKASGWRGIATDWVRLKGDERPHAVFTLDVEDFGPCTTLYVLARQAGEGVGFAWLHLRKVVVARTKP